MSVQMVCPLPYLCVHGYTNRHSWLEKGQSSTSLCGGCTNLIRPGDPPVALSRGTTLTRVRRTVQTQNYWPYSYHVDKDC